MPLYESICSKCNTRHEYVKSIAEMNETPMCCGSRTFKRIFTPPAAQFDIQPWDSYVSPATGKVITSKAERKEDMEKSGCRQWEGMSEEKKHAANLKQEQDQKEDKKLEEEVRKVWAQLPEESKKTALDAII